MTECGIVVKPHTDIGSASPLDTVIISGGNGIRDGKVTKKVAKWLNHRRSTTGRIVANHHQRPVLVRRTEEEILVFSVS